MALLPGVHLGPYEIVSAVGSGGMGEVYRARDTRLDRTVALKVLAPALAADPQFRERFDREARAISQLTHPHICTLYDVGHHNGTDYLVLEYLEGETLADRLQKGALPLEQALRLAIQIADALDTAHRAGIVHRDLKPGNVMLTKPATRGGLPPAKLLDFGLARASAAGTAAAATVLPTTPPGLTAQGTILGTFPYMAPEQIEGLEADRRTDIFAFGCVLYEMVTGNRAFQGKTHASVMSAIMQREPTPIAALVPLSPPALDHVVRRCLAKDPEARWQDVRDAAEELRWIAGEGAPAGARTVARTWRERFPWAATGVLALALLAAAPIVVGHLREAGQPLEPVRFGIDPPSTAVFSNNPAAPFPAVSPDGRRIAFVAGAPGQPPRLWVRSIANLEAQPLAGTEGAFGPFWAPDSRALGFFAAGKLKTIEASGGPVSSLCDVSAGVVGGTWSQDGVILFGQSEGLFRVPASGGQPVRLTAPELTRKDISPRFPSFLPDGRRFVYLAYPTNTIWMASLDTNEATRLLSSDSRAEYAPPGYLLFTRQGTLLAQPFAARGATLTGEAVPIAERIGVAPPGIAAFSASDTGVLAYRSAAPAAPTQLTWVDRAGRTLGTVGRPGMYRNPALSPTGTRLAVEMADAQGRNLDVWILELTRDVASRFTFDPGNDIYPAWSPDGSRIMFASDREGGVFNLYQKLSNLAGEEELVLKAGSESTPFQWSPDGRYVVYRTQHSGSGVDIGLLPLSGDRKPRLYRQTPFNEGQSQISPDGRWMAYISNETGRFEIYVQSFPTPGGKWQVSRDGGFNPRWRGDGKELFYHAADGRLMAVPVKGDAAFEVGAAAPLFNARMLGGPAAPLGLKQQYDVARDGQRFLLNVPTDSETASPVTVVLNWASTLAK